MFIYLLLWKRHDGKGKSWIQRRRQRETKCNSKKRETDWVKRAAESGAKALSPVSVTVGTAAHISSSPWESKSPPGNEGAEKAKSTCSLWLGQDCEEVWGCSSVAAPQWASFSDYTENEAKVTVEELMGVQKLSQRTGPPAALSCERLSQEDISSEVCDVTGGHAQQEQHRGFVYTAYQCHLQL